MPDQSIKTRISKNSGSASVQSVQQALSAQRKTRSQQIHCERAEFRSKFDQKYSFNPS
jgi:hypothetical protein